MFTPHARGSTSIFLYLVTVSSVYPACAGIDPSYDYGWEIIVGLPRMRGDRPFFIFVLTLFIEFTPHARGSTSKMKMKMKIVEVYPACAGIDPLAASMKMSTESLPRMRGDRPSSSCSSSYSAAFTPHARGSTWYVSIDFHSGEVYPACAGIDLYAPCAPCTRVCLPRMRGDRPNMAILKPFVP